MESTLIKKITVPVDYSETSRNALALALEISRQHQASLHLLYVVEQYQCISISENGLIIDFSKESIKAAELKRLQKLANELIDGQTAYVVECRIANDLSTAVVEAALEHESDLIVMGTQVTSGFVSHFVGSVAYDVVKTAPCPVLTVPNHRAWTVFKKILFPVRPVATALEKYDLAKEMIRHNKAEMTVLGLYNEDTPQLSDALTEMLSKLEIQLKYDRIRASIELADTEEGAELVLFKSRQLDVDLIIITADESETSGSFFESPYTEQIINQSKVPVLSIRPAPVRVVQMQPIGAIPAFSVVA
ncbi:universal stress protein [Runella salmonicolor]|uniref:Universal stress protein n=1 Tax=Runella salmonicolor TaxID=2950278 RepID=A0ABT1FI76_9BACT|nr:universal stress protein [Runella salmonicolor]MCP1381475.1 universal stress protein [Runella salmonicolor]